MKRAHDASEVFEQFPVPVQITIRTCVQDDLPGLEWFGAFSEHRQIIESTFESQARGENLMLIAEANSFPVGQIWIDLVPNAKASAGYLWALRVLPCLQNLGLGARLLSHAEQLLRKRHFRSAELAVEKNNLDARRFYERRGYLLAGETTDKYSYVAPGGNKKHVPMKLWLMRKDLSNAASPKGGKA